MDGIYSAYAAWRVYKMIQHAYFGYTMAVITYNVGTAAIGTTVAVAKYFIPKSKEIPKMDIKIKKDDEWNIISLEPDVHMK